MHTHTVLLNLRAQHFQYASIQTRTQLIIPDGAVKCRQNSPYHPQYNTVYRFLNQVPLSPSDTAFWIRRSPKEKKCGAPSGSSRWSERCLRSYARQAHSRSHGEKTGECYANDR